jgi:C4-dicarboxylate-specific signal transduction histidine kinase
LAICTRVAAALEDRMRRAGVEFELRYGAEIPRVMVDRTQLEIVVHNLLTNSLDAFDSVQARGSRMRRIELTAQAESSEVLIAIDDSGPGISPALVDRLFDPFVTSKISGMGLGLSLSRTFLRHQGGDMWHEPSRLGGARFIIRLSTQAKLQSNL